MTEPRRWRLNPRALRIVAALSLTGLAVIVVCYRHQQSQGHSALLAEARKRIAAKDDALALTYLRAYLEREPRDIAALELTATTLVRTAGSPADLLDAIQLYERILRIQTDSRSERAQKARREMVRLHLSVGPHLPRSLQRYRTADVLAGQLLDGGDRDAEALRLRGLVKQRLAMLGDDSALAEAIGFFEQARQLKPGMIEGAKSLADAYRDQNQDLPKAVAVMDELIAANPSAAAHLARFRFFQETARGLTARANHDSAREFEDRAEADLQRAVERAPNDLNVCLAAAEHALQLGRNEEARRHLDRVPLSLQASNRFRVVSGIAELQENNVEEAIATWRRGLLMSDGTDAELTWWLANIQLELGRLTEASALIEQYRRLAGGERPTPGWHYLEGVRLLRQGSPTRAILELQEARARAAVDLLGPIALALGRCYEAIRDVPSALSAYREAFEADPSLAAARLEYSRLLQSNHPADARLALREGLDRIGDDPRLLAGLARAELDRQLGLPVSQRSWDELNACLDRARQIAPEHPAVAIAEAAILRRVDRPRRRTAGWPRPRRPTRRSRRSGTRGPRPWSATATWTAPSACWRRRRVPKRRATRPTSASCEPDCSMRWAGARRPGTCSSATSTGSAPIPEPCSGSPSATSTASAASRSRPAVATSKGPVSGPRTR